MGGRAGLVLAPEVRAYDHGPGHPLRPERVLYTWELIRACGLMELPSVETLAGRPATDEEVLLVHEPEFVEATRRAGHGEEGPWHRYGYGPGDNPVFPNMHEAAAAVVGASLVAAEAVLEGRVAHAFSAPGGLHHAMPARASGFCVYNDPAIAIARMLAHGLPRVAYVDVDAHHGDGVQAVFWRDPRVLTISLHESGEYVFPGTGFVHELGGGEAEGTKVNVPLHPGTGDRAWLRAIEAIVPPLVRAFRPSVLVTQLGCDTHATDPIAHLRLTTGAYRETARALHALAHEAAGGRWLATGGGGYQWARVVPRAWTLYFAEMADAEIPDELPESFIEAIEFRLRAEVPATFSEDPLPEPERDEDVEDVIALVRRTIFPRLGLEP